MRYLVGAAALAALVTALPSAGAGKPRIPEGQPETFEALIKCRAVADEKARLQCFDRAAAVLEEAAARRDLVVVDRKQMRETRRTLFGLEIPRLKIFGGGDDEGEEVKQIEGVVASAYPNGNGQWVIRLEDGATWVQTDQNTVAVAPKRGTKVVIHRAALGSYMMRIGGQPGVRAKRQL